MSRGARGPAGVASAALGLALAGVGCEPQATGPAATVAPPAEPAAADRLAAARLSAAWAAWADGRPFSERAFEGLEPAAQARARALLAHLAAVVDEAPIDEPLGEREPDAVPLVPPLIDPSFDEPDGRAARGGPSGPPASPGGAGAPKRSPRISKVGLSKQGGKIRLKVIAGARVVLGTASSAGGRTVRILVRGSEVDEAALKARPELGGVKVSAITRGVDAVTITVELAPGWSLVSDRGVSDGAELVFRGP